MFKNLIYNGEIWIEGGFKHFCVLEKTEEGKIILKTSLSTNAFHEDKIDIIYGEFNGIGYMTFIGNFRIKSSMGITHYNEYMVKYSFNSRSGFLDLNELDIYTASYYNNTIALLQGKNGWIDLNTNKYHRSGDLDISTKIGSNDLDELIIECFKNLNTSRVSLTLKTQSLVKFKFRSYSSLSNLLSCYNTYKNFMLLFFGYFEQFKSIKLSLKNNSSFELYYNDRFTQTKINSIYSLLFSDIIKEYLKLLKNWFKDEPLRFVCSSVIDNIIYSSMNPHKRFLNSYYSLEGWLKFRLKKDKIKLKKDVSIIKEDFQLLSGLNSVQVDKFIVKCIRHRDHYVHNNANQKQIFTETEAFKASRLFEYVLMVQILKKLDCSKELLETAINKFSYKYKHSRYDFSDYMRIDGKL